MAMSKDELIEHMNIVFGSLSHLDGEECTAVLASCIVHHLKTILDVDVTTTAKNFLAQGFADTIAMLTVKAEDLGVTVH